MKQLLWLIILLLFTPDLSHAGPKEDYEEAYKLYIAAGASVAVYDDRIGALATRYLQHDGWQISHYVQEKDQAGARYLLASKTDSSGKDIYIMAFAGTENAEDVKLNLAAGKIYFAGAAPETLAANAEKKSVPATEPKIHKGFAKYLQAGLLAKLRDHTGDPLSLTEILEGNKNFHLILTGHSLGGAAATLAGASLINMGISPEQLEVISFGAPAVGNAAFAAAFDPVLKLTRVVIYGDPVTGILQTLVGGYRQFGHELRWRIPKTVKHPHQIIGYVDVAMKNYYDKRRQAITAGIELPQPSRMAPVGNERIYIAPLQSDLPDSLAKEYWYMNEALWDEYQQTFSDYLFVRGTDPQDWLHHAAASGCRWLIVPTVNGSTLKYEQNRYHITFSQTLYDLTTGAAVETAVFSTATFKLTPLQAFLHTVKGVNIDQTGYWQRVAQ